MITGFYQVFESKLDRIYEDLKKELKKEKKDRRRDFLKYNIKRAKNLKKLLKNLKLEMGTVCPHCGGKL